MRKIWSIEYFIIFKPHYEPLSINSNFLLPEELIRSHSTLHFSKNCFGLSNIICANLAPNLAYEHPLRSKSKKISLPLSRWIMGEVMRICLPHSANYFYIHVIIFNLHMY